MKTTKTLKVMAMICAGIICMQGYAAAGQDVDATALDTGTAYMADADNNSTGNAADLTAPVKAGLNKLAVVAAAATYLAAPWGFISAVVAVQPGVGMIAEALSPAHNDLPQYREPVEKLAHKKADNNAALSLAANE